MTELIVRPERMTDVGRVREVVTQAFESEAEAKLVDVLRGATDPQISLVAEREGEVVGHVLFTPVEVHGESGVWRAMGLAPLAVRPGAQRQGVGVALTEVGLSRCRELGENVVVVLGHSTYYPRFGFRPAWDFGLYFGEPGPQAAFMVCELEPGALAGRSGEVRYHPAFGSL